MSGAIRSEKPFYNSDKKICMLLTNCHGGRLCQVLRHHQQFMDAHELDYRRIDLRQMPDQEDLDRCRVFLYQYLGDKWGDMASHRLLPRLPESCLAIRLPKLSSSLYWPYFSRPGVADSSWCNPCKEFPYFDGFLLECVAQTMDPEQSVREYLTHDVAGEFNLDARLADNIAYLRDPLNCGDVDLNPLILDRLDKEVFFASPNHPSIALLAEEANLILEMLGYNRVDRSEAMNSILEWDFFLPVHPGIIEHFFLVHPTKETRYPMGERRLNFKEYSLSYARHYAEERQSFLAA